MYLKKNAAHYFEYLKKFIAVLLRHVKSKQTTSLSLKELLPKTVLHWISAIVLLASFLFYVGAWIDSNSNRLFNKTYQNDDVRIHAMAMHRYAGNEAIKNDSVALDMYSCSTLGLRILYRIFVPVAGVLGTPKIIQLICHLIVFVCMIMLIRSKNAGLASGILLGFFMLFTQFAVNRMTGGLQRNFGFPLLALWFTGAVIDSKRVRTVAAILGSMTYPVAMAIVLGAEGINILRNITTIKTAVFWRTVGIYCATVVTCIALTQVDQMTKPYGGSLPTYEQAAQNSAFYAGGRSVQIPFASPFTTARRSFFSIIDVSGNSKNFEGSKTYKELDASGPILILFLILLLFVAKVTISPKHVVALLCSTAIVYCLARIFAFRLLFVPDRYIRYGMTFTSIILFVTVFGGLWSNVKNIRHRAIYRNITAVIVMVGMILIAGDHLRRDVGITISKTTNNNHLVWDFIETLPKDIRIAAHPSDASPVSFWTGRRSTPGEEQLMPWLDDMWNRNKRLAENTLTALYATEHDTIRSFCKKEKITHFLINTKRYTASFKQKAQFFQPFGKFAKKLTKKLNLKNLIFFNIPKKAIVFENKESKLIIVDVRKLQDEWAK